MSESAAQRARFETVRQLSSEKMTELSDTIALRRQGKADEARAIMLSDRGRVAMDGIRAAISDMEAEERQSLTLRQAEWETASDLSVRITWLGSAILLALIGLAAWMASRDFRNSEAQGWVRSAQAAVGIQLQGEQRLDVLGDTVLAFLAARVDAQVGTVYVQEATGRLRLIASYALPRGAAPATIEPGEGLLGQSARENRMLHVTDIPDGYLPVASSVGQSKARELMIVPATMDGVVYAVIELGFLRRVQAPERELLSRVSEALGVAVRSSRDRTQLEELLGTTQRQAEELQVQQEELRVNNEELEEQSQVLKESQARLETQQAELEQINSQLAEQADILERQRDELAVSQAILTDKAAELERSNQYKSEFLANMSHELRTPLNSSLILAKLLADNKGGNLTAEQVTFAQTIYSAGNDLLALINDILDLSKIEAGKVEISPSTVALVGVVDSLVKALRAARGAEGHPVLDRHRARTARGDRERRAARRPDSQEPAVERLQVHRPRQRHAAGLRAATAVSVAFAVRDTGSASRRRSRRSSSRRSGRPTAARTANTAAPASASRSRATSRACSAVTSACTARLARAAPSP